MVEKDSLDLHGQSIVIDAVCPLLNAPQYIDWYRAGGVTALAPTVGSTGNTANTLRRLAPWVRLLRERADLALIRRADDIETVKRDGRLGVYFHLQGTDPIEDNLDLIDVYKSLGVGIIQLTYNVRNRVGDGCEEPVDGGLSRFGVRVVERLNQARVIVDCSHTGPRTTLDAIERSNAPVVLSHSNISAVYPSPRNVSYELLDAVAGSGGIVGIAGFPGLVANSAKPTLDQFIAHIDAVVERVGVDYVGLGIDYYGGQWGVASDEQALDEYQDALRTGIWSSAYPPPPHIYPGGIETPRTLPNLTRRLLERGYQEQQVRKILGGNWLRVMRSVWG